MGKNRGTPSSKTMILVRIAPLLLTILTPLSVCQIARTQAEPIRITADLTESGRQLYHAELDLPVQPGIATFTSPRWIPGSHSPNGPISNITGVVFTANSKTLPWRRDDLALAEFHGTRNSGQRGIQDRTLKHLLRDRRPPDAADPQVGQPFG
jgi:hypothetical protein